MLVEYLDGMGLPDRLKRNCISSLLCMCFKLGQEVNESHFNAVSFSLLQCCQVKYAINIKQTRKYMVIKSEMINMVILVLPHPWIPHPFQLFGREFLGTI
jgi:hypothetical protein